MDIFKLRCRRCRCIVLYSDDVVNTHGQPLKETSCSSISTSSVWFVSVENEELLWIQEAISQAMWIKGKLNCPKCNSRLGSFDFVKSTHCPCGQQTLPGVYILRDRVDKMLVKQASQQQNFSNRFARCDNPLIKEYAASDNHLIKEYAASDSPLVKEDARSDSPPLQQDAKSDSPLIKEASINPQVTSSQECSGVRSVSGETQRHTAAKLPQGCDPAGLLDGSEGDAQGQAGYSRTAGVVLREPRTDLQLCVSVSGVDPGLAASAVEMDHLISNDVRVNSHQIHQVCVNSRHRRSGINPDSASENRTSVSRTLVSHGCNHGSRSSKCRGFGDRCSVMSQMELVDDGHGSHVKPRQQKEELRSRRRKKLQSKQRGPGRVDDDDDEERLDRETLNRFRHLEEEQSSTDDSIIEETVMDEHECPVCLDMFFHPHICHPCGHVFCETCLRHLTHESDNSTAFPCPMCRILIISCSLDRDLTATIKLKYPVSYKHRRMIDSQYLSHRYPLPRSTGRSNRHTINERIVYAMGGNENIYTLMSRLWLKCFTFLGAVILVLLVLCVSLAL